MRRVDAGSLRISANDKFLTLNSRLKELEAGRGLLS